MKRKQLQLAIALGLSAAVAAPAFAIIGRPLTPVSFAGAARRSVRRSAYYGGAAAYGAYGAAAYGAGAYGGAAYGGAAYGGAPLYALPAGCMVGAPCGGVVYQPVYQGTTVVYVPR
jgi:hypothetical protein